MRHFNYVRFTDDGNTDPFKLLIGVRCILNGRCICQIVRMIPNPSDAVKRIIAEAELDSIEDEVRDTVDRMDPEVLL